MKRITTIVFLLVLSHAAPGIEIKKISLPVPAGMKRADIYFVAPVQTPLAVLVLCPGMNGNGSNLLRDEKWIAYARKEHIALVGLSFASDEKDLNEEGKGYYNAELGSGEVLLNGIKRCFKIEKPILLYGFSGGAHFASSFAEWQPRRVLAWCAYSAGWWGELNRSSQQMPPGIVACGENDWRYGTSLSYFLRGRALGRRITWVGLKATDHAWSERLDAFVRSYFTAIINQKNDHLKPEWRDAEVKGVLTDAEAALKPTLACWLPNGEVAKEWAEIHRP